MKVILTSGKRKTAIARAVIKEGKGMVKVNNVPVEIMTPEFARMKVLEPLLLAGEDKVNKVDLSVDVHGGGFISQAEAAGMSIARGLTKWYKDSKLKKSLLEYDRTLLVGDARRAEAKKFGGAFGKSKKTEII